MTPAAVMPAWVFVAALLAGLLVFVAAWCVYRHAAEPPRLRVVQPSGVRIVDPVEAPWDWADWDDGGSTA